MLWHVSVSIQGKLSFRTQLLHTSRVAVPRPDVV